METILQAIGNTPLVEIKKLNPNPNVKIFAKLEGFNPGGSMKDRVALAIIENAEKAGVLTKDKTVIEVTNGNTGVGIAMVAEEYPTWGERARSVLPDLLTFAGLGLALGVAGSFLLSRLIRRRTRGLEPAAIAALADQREALLHSIREGVFAVGDDGTVTMMSDSARELVGLGDDIEGRRVDDLDLDLAVRGLLVDEAEIRDHVVVLGDRVLVVNRNPVLERGRRVATVTTLRDRTELLALQSELSARESITNTLRAQTHEFHNQLHTISGLVQLGEYDEVSRLVGTLSWVASLGPELARLAGGSELVVSLVWADKPEFRGEVDEELGVHAGLKWSFDGTKGAN